MIYGDETTFSRNDAIRLNELVPADARAASLGIVAAVKTTGSTTRGHAAGVGNVSVDGGEKTHSVGNAMRGTVRAGQWVFDREGHDIGIRQMMADSLEEGRKVKLMFARDGEPKSMKLQVPIAFKLGPMVLKIGRFANRKVPAVDL